MHGGMGKRDAINPAFTRRSLLLRTSSVLGAPDPDPRKFSPAPRSRARSARGSARPRSRVRPSPAPVRGVGPCVARVATPTGSRARQRGGGARPRCRKLRACATDHVLARGLSWEARQTPVSDPQHGNDVVTWLPRGSYSEDAHPEATIKLAIVSQRQQAGCDPAAVTFRECEVQQLSGRTITVVRGGCCNSAASLDSRCSWLQISPGSPAGNRQQAAGCHGRQAASSVCSQLPPSLEQARGAEERGGSRHTCCVARDCAFQE
jgi:hypothetical protein